MSESEFPYATRLNILHKPLELIDGGSIELNKQQGYVVPKGTVHRTRAPEKTIILMVESAGIIPTGDAG
jgi:hypothetical protein